MSLRGGSKPIPPRATATGSKQRSAQSTQSIVRVNEVIAVQAGALWVSDPSEGCSEGGAKLRVLGGRSFSGGRGFFNAEGAVRALSGGCEGSRIDSTAGYRPAENWLAMGQVFVDSPVEGDDSIKAQVTIVRFRPPRPWVADWPPGPYRWRARRTCHCRRLMGPAARLVACGVDFRPSWSHIRKTWCVGTVT